MKEKILKFLCKNPKLYSNTLYLEDLLSQEDYVIYFYIKQFCKGDIEFTRDSLKIALNEQKLYWINPKSKLSEKFDRVHKEYIQSKTIEFLNDDNDFGNALVNLVLKRYDEIQNVEDISIEEYNSIISTERANIQIELFQNILAKISPLITRQEESLVYNNVRYTASNILELVSKMAVDKSLAVSGIANYISKEEEHESQLRQVASGKTTADRVFTWNISGNQRLLPDAIPGDVIGIVAEEKVGKTRFTIGEAVYPALCLGKNVKIYSGEMEISELYAILAIKHMYSLYGVTLDFNIAKDIIIISEKIKDKSVTDIEIEKLNSYDREYIEYVLNGVNFFKYNKAVGRLKLVRAGDVQNSNEFVMENVLTNNMAELQNTNPEDRTDLVVFDHVNLFKSRIGMKLEDFIQDIVKLTKNVIHPLVSIVINHMKTADASEKINNKTTLKDLEELDFSSHGTSELQKSTTLYMNLIRLPELEKAGQIALKVARARGFDIMKTLRTNVFKLIAYREVSDFILVGQQKLSYEYKDLNIT